MDIEWFGPTISGLAGGACAILLGEALGWVRALLFGAPDRH
jgi:hypothetical protein